MLSLRTIEHTLLKLELQQFASLINMYQYRY